MLLVRIYQLHILETLPDCSLDIFFKLTSLLLWQAFITLKMQSNMQ